MRILWRNDGCLQDRHLKGELVSDPQVLPWCLLEAIQVRPQRTCKLTCGQRGEMKIYFVFCDWGHHLLGVVSFITSEETTQLSGSKSVTINTVAATIFHDSSPPHALLLLTWTAEAPVCEFCTPPSSKSISSHVAVWDNPTEQGCDWKQKHTRRSLIWTCAAGTYKSSALPFHTGGQQTRSWMCRTAAFLRHSQELLLHLDKT